MTYGSGATGSYFGYDNMGRVVTQKQVTGSSPTTYSLSYAYNYAGMLTGETYPSNRTVTYGYGTAGKLSSVSDGSTTFANSFEYKPLGGLHSETLGNGMVHKINYNHALQPNQVKLTLGTAVLQQYDYDYGAFNTSTGAVDKTKNNGQIGKITSTITTTAQWNQGFSYDEVGRLSNIKEHQGSTMSTQTFSQSYSYDRFGNRTQSANSTLGLAAVSSSDYDTNNNNNRFVSSVATYNNAGNMTTDAKFRSFTYAYDANGRQTSASNGTWTQTQVYDAAGQRVRTTNGSATRTMVYDIFGQDVADYSGSSGGTLERENIYRGGQLLATYEGSTLKYALIDAQGSTRAIMDNNGGSSSVIARHDYLPFGEEIGSTIGSRNGTPGYGATDLNRQKYGLTERDDTTELDHTWFRKYESKSGRWTSPDPLGGNIEDPQSFNSYVYTRNDPVNLVDPSGLDPQDPPAPVYPIDAATGLRYTPGVPGLSFGVNVPSGIQTSVGVGSYFDGNFLTEVNAGIEAVSEGIGIYQKPKKDRNFIIVREKRWDYGVCVRREWGIFNQKVERIVAAAQKRFDENQLPWWIELIGGMGGGESSTFGDAATDKIKQYGPTIYWVMVKQEEIRAGREKEAAARDLAIKNNCKEPNR